MLARVTHVALLLAAVVSQATLQAQASAAAQARHVAGSGQLNPPSPAK